MNKGLILSMIILMIFCLVGPASAGANKKKKNKGTTEKITGKTPAKYEKLFKGKTSETRKGMITLHKIGPKVYFEFPKVLLGREFILGSTIVKTSDNSNGLVGQMPNAPLHVIFTLKDSVFQMRQADLMSNLQSLTYSDSPEAGVQEAIKKSNTPAIIAAFKVEAISPDSTAVVVDMTEFFTKHHNDMNPFWRYSKRTVEYGWANRAVKLDKDLASIEGIKAFGNNVSVITSLSYKQDIVIDGAYLVAKNEPVTATLNRTLMLLPDKNELMTPRLGDPRININTVARENMTTKVDRAQMTHYMTRWNLEPKDKAAFHRGELTEPVKPIVFYIDNKFPEGWSEYIIAGITEWNKAFEAIGFKNAIRVKPFPQNDPDFDPDNINYSCVRYAPTSIYSVLAGPQWADPRSGEIMTASLYVFQDAAKQINYERFVQTAQVDPKARTLKLPMERFGESLKGMVAGEMGSILGFLPNSAASHAYPTDSLRSSSFTREHGLTPSIMDIIPFNYVAQPGDEGVVLAPSKIGPADFHTVKVAYKPTPATTPEEDLAVVQGWIAEKMGDPVYRYGKRQYLLTTFDPTTLDGDLGDDALKASAYGIRNIKYILTHMNEWLDHQDIDYTYRDVIYKYLVYQYEKYLFNVYINIGGFRLNEHFVGDPVPTFTPLSKDLQKHSLAFVMKELKNLAWLDNYDVIKNLSFDGSEALRILKTYVLKMQNVTTELFVTKRLSLVSYRDKDNYSPKEYLDDLYAEIWDSAIKGRDVTEPERILQTEFIRRTRDVVDFNGKKNRFGDVYAADPQMSQEDMVRMISQMCGSQNPVPYRLDEESNDQTENSAFGSRWLIYNIAADNTNHLWNAIYDKAIGQVKKRQGSGNEDTRAHYDYLMYLINRSLKKAPTW